MRGAVAYSGEDHLQREEQETSLISEQEDLAREASPNQTQNANPSEEETDFETQRTRFLTELHGDPRRCPHPFRFREWSMENPSQDIGWNVSERRTYRCRICGRVVTERV